MKINHQKVFLRSLETSARLALAKKKTLSSSLELPGLTIDRKVTIEYISQLTAYVHANRKMQMLCRYSYGEGSGDVAIKAIKSHVEN